MAAMNMVSARGLSGVSFHLRSCPQGVASVLCKKTPIFRSRRLKLDHLTVTSIDVLPQRSSHFAFNTQLKFTRIFCLKFERLKDSETNST
jgi:hypothetical protein